jgi:hypothetical protein
LRRTGPLAVFRQGIRATEPFVRWLDAQAQAAGPRAVGDDDWE